MPCLIPQRRAAAKARFVPQSSPLRVFSERPHYSKAVLISRRILQEAETRWQENTEIDRVIGTLVSFRRPAQVRDPISVEMKDIDDPVKEIGKLDLKLEEMGLLAS